MHVNHLDQELQEGEFLELADLMQPLDKPEPANINMPNMDDNSAITLSLGSNGIPDSDSSQGNAMEAVEGIAVEDVEGNANLKLQGQQILNGLPDLSLLLGPLHPTNPC